MWTRVAEPDPTGECRGGREIQYTTDDQDNDESVCLSLFSFALVLCIRVGRTGTRTIAVECIAAIFRHHGKFVYLKLDEHKIRYALKIRACYSIIGTHRTL